MKNRYRILSLEEFVKQLPKGDSVLYVGQRQSGRGLTADVFNAFQRLDGDSRKVVHYDCIGEIDGPTTTKLSLSLADRNLVIRGERCVQTRTVDTSAPEIKRVFEAVPQTYTRNKYDIPVIFVASVNFPGVSTTMLVRMRNPDEASEESWLLTAFGVSSQEPYGDITISDAKDRIRSIVDWLWRFNVTSVNEALEPAVNPYYCGEEVYVELLSKNVGMYQMYQLTMAKEMLEIHSGIELVKYDGDNVQVDAFDHKATSCGWGSVDV